MAREEPGLSLTIARNVPEVVYSTIAVEGKEMHRIEVERGSIGTTGRLAEYNHAMVVVGEDLCDVKALRAGGQPVIAHQGRFDVVDPHWGAAERTPSIEMDDPCGRQVFQCLGQVAHGQGCVRVADSLHIRVLGHGCFYGRRERELRGERGSETKSEVDHEEPNRLRPASCRESSLTNR